MLNANDNVIHQRAKEILNDTKLTQADKTERLYKLGFSSLEISYLLRKD